MKNSVAFFQLIALDLFMLTTNAQKRLYQPGNITIGVLLNLHSQESINICGEFHSIGLGHVEAISYAVSQINKNASILSDVKLGIDVRDYCRSPMLAVSVAHSIQTNNILNDLLVAQRNTKTCPFPLGTYLNITSPVVAVIGTGESSSASLVASFFQVKFVIISCLFTKNIS